jgi:hypothetical protein
MNLCALLHDIKQSTTLTNSKIAVIGIDIGKNSFHIVGQDRRGALVLRQKWSRGPSGSAARQPAAVSHRHGGLHRVRWT